MLNKNFKQIAAVIPAVRRLLAHRDALVKENENLRNEVVTLTGDLKAARAKLLKAWQNNPDIWVPPGHFYSPIPALLDLEVNEEEVFTPPPAIRGIDLNEGMQLDLLNRFAAFYGEQPFTPEAVPGRRYFFENPNYSYNDAIVLYCMMRHFRPRRIVEIGSGYSSCAMLDVNELFFNDSIAFTFIDPYSQLLRDLIKQSDEPRVRILGQKVQDVDVEVFRELEASDILFIDSSHVVKTGSDVNYILFKVLPLLKEGVIIHVHDIFYPFEYPLDWVYQGRAWNEAYLLRAFLQYNNAFEIQFFNSFMIGAHRDIFELKMPLCLKIPGANLWLKKIKHDQELDRADARRGRVLKTPPASLDLTRTEHARFLGDGWYEPEPDHCWMTQISAFQIAGPTSSGQRLSIRATTPLDGSRLSATVEGIDVGSADLGPAGDTRPEFPLPDECVGRASIAVRLSIDRVHTVEGDPRKLGLAASKIEIR